MFYAILIFGIIFYTLYKIYKMYREKEQLERELVDAYNYAKDSWKKFKAGFKS